MKMKRFSFACTIVIFLLQGMASGLEMCTGVFETPSFTQLTMNQVSDGARLGGVEISLEMTSTVPVTLVWMSQKGNKLKVASEDNPSFINSSVVVGDRFVFKLNSRLHKNATNRRDILREIIVTLVFKYGCNEVMTTDILSTIDKLIQYKMKIPSIAEMPKERYFINSDDEAFTLKMSFPKRALTGVGQSYHGCQYLYEQKDGLLKKFPPLQSGWSTLNSTLHETGHVLEVVCRGKLPRDSDSRIIAIETGWTNSSLGRFYVSLGVVTELRRPRYVNKPAVSVEAEAAGTKTVNNGDILIPVVAQKIIRFQCVAGGYDRPYIALARGSDINVGHFETIPSVYGVSDHYLPPLRVATYEVESPGADQEEEYICSAASGGEVTSQRFKLRGYRPITFAKKDRTKTPVIYIRDITGTESLNVSCEASGTPAPEMRFYANVGPFVYPPDPEQFVREFAQKELHSSDNYDVSITKQGTRTHGTLFVKDVKKAVPSGYWENPRNYVFAYLCLAYNEFGADTQHLASIFE